jgi:hypothetical protein
MVIGYFPLTENLPLPGSLADLTADNQKRLSPGLQIDYLRRHFGLTETDLNERNIQSLSTEDHIAPLSRYFSIRAVAAHDDIPRLDLKEAFQEQASKSPLIERGIRETTTDFATGYAAVEVDSRTAAKTMLLIGADDTAIAWLNGERIYRRLTAAEVSELTCNNLEMVPVHLKQGANFLLFKVYNLQRDWILSVRLLSMSGARAWLKETQAGYLQNRFVAETRGVQLTGIAQALYCETARCSLQIDGPVKRSVTKPQLSANGDSLCFPLPKLPAGIYRTHLSSPYGQLEDRFYVGQDLADLAGHYESALRGANPNDAATINIEAAISRLRHLLDLPVENRLETRWQRKALFAITESETALARLRTLDDPAKDVPGLHLRGYRSEIDGQVQNYMVYAPSTYRRSSTPYPVVTVIPYITVPSRPFLESFHVAYLERIFRFERLADQYGFVVIWPNGRSGTSVGHPVGRADLWEALNAAGNLYNLDDNRLYLIGECSGGLEALTLASQYPSKFAAVALTSPIYRRFNSSRAERLSFDSDEELRAQDLWNAQNSPRATLENLRNLPVLVVHEKEHIHAPFEASVKFVAESKRRGVQIAFVPWPKPEAAPNSGTTSCKPCAEEYPELECFRFFNGKARRSAPREVTLTAYDLKHAKAYWLEVTERMTAGKPIHIEARVTDNRIIVESENVASFRIDTESFDAGNTPRRILTWSGRLAFSGVPPLHRITVDNSSTSDQNFHKSADSEGPIADTFSHTFVIVRGVSSADIAGRTAIDKVATQLQSNWRKSYFVECPMKQDIEITPEDIARRNLVLIGNPGTSGLVERVMAQLPLAVSQDRLNIAKRSFTGRSLGLTMVYPNPLNPKKYVLLITASCFGKFRYPIANPWLEGTFDYAVWNNDSRLLGFGNFNDQWR